MVTIAITHQVKDFSVWISAFEEHSGMRKEGGSQSAKVLQDVNDPNNVTVVCEWDSVDNFNSFMQAPEMKEVMETAGITSEPSVLILNQHKSYGG